MFLRMSLATLLAGWAANTASAQPMDLLSFSFSDLHAVWDGNALLNIADDGDSDGEISRLLPPPTDDAFFFGDAMAGGFPGLAAFDMTMTVANVTASGAIGTGDITFTDFNGDTFSGMVIGNWINVTGSANFVGQLGSFVPNNPSGDGMFDGTDGSGFSMVGFPASPPFVGDIITLVADHWFTLDNGQLSPFEAPTTLLIGAVVPEPATAALIILGALLVDRRRL